MKQGSRSGWHLTLDACVDDTGPISDIECLRSMLLEIVALLRMKLLDGPRMTEVVLNPDRIQHDEDEGGITGYCLITTSHLSIHTWPLRGRFCLDIFSCRYFDHRAAMTLIRERLSVSEESVTWLERRWPATERQPV